MNGFGVLAVKMSLCSQKRLKYVINPHILSVNRENIKSFLSSTLQRCHFFL